MIPIEIKSGETIQPSMFAGLSYYSRLSGIDPNSGCLIYGGNDCFKEISKKEKIFFYDTGIRNSLISRFNPLEFREDIGGLWENFMIVERMKMLENRGKQCNRYFWRTHDRQEVDYIEEYDDHLDAYEFKWRRRRVRETGLFLATYPGSRFRVVTRDNFRAFVLP